MSPETDEPVEPDEQNEQDREKDPPTTEVVPCNICGVLTRSPSQVCRSCSITIEQGW